MYNETQISNQIPNRAQSFLGSMFQNGVNTPNVNAVPFRWVRMEIVQLKNRLLSDAWLYPMISKHYEPTDEYVMIMLKQTGIIFFIREEKQFA